METPEAQHLAREQGLDLIEISGTAVPPVCKITEFGKFKYANEKFQREHGKKQRDVEIKGIRIGFTTGRHDLEMRAKQVMKFLEDGDKVRIDMRLRGREKAHGALALRKFNEFLEMIPAAFKLEAPPRRFPQGFIAVAVKK